MTVDLYSFPPDRFTLSPSLSLRSVASNLPFTYTGADLYALCSDAMLKAITRRATSVDSKVRSLNSKRASTNPPLEPISVAHFFDHLAAPEDTEVLVEEEDFMAAMRELVPSVSVKELEHYEKVRSTFETGDDGTRGKKTIPAKMSNGKGNSSDNYDDFVSRTEGLSLDEHGGSTANGNAIGGKGKGKAREFDAHDFGFGKAVDVAEEEDLYSP